MFHGVILHGRVLIACNGFKLLQGFLFFALAYNGYNIHQENLHPASVERFWYHNAHHWQFSEAQEKANHSPWTSTHALGGREQLQTGIYSGGAWTSGHGSFSLAGISSNNASMMSWQVAEITAVRPC